MNLIPPIGATGLYVVAEPYSKILLSNVSYCCMAVRKLTDVINLGIDPFVTYYDSYGLAQTSYEADLAADACIVSLQATDGSWIYVPTTYITKYPEVNGVAYNVVALALNLGAIPDGMDLTYIKNKLRQDLVSILGITPDIQTVVMSNTTLISQAAHLTAETARKASIALTNTDYSENISLREQNTKLLTKIAKLETYIASKLPATPPTTP